MKEFAACYPAVPIHPERVLVISGLREDLVSSGASNTWHDMVLYLIAHHVGATVAQEVARMFALQWHQDGLAPYMIFEGRNDHGVAEIQSAQEWLASHFSIASPVDEMIKRSKLAERTFKRRFADATGLAPIAYVQRLRRRQTKAGAHQFARGRDQLACGLRGCCILPPFVQAHHRDDAGCLSATVPDTEVRPGIARVCSVRGAADWKSRVILDQSPVMTNAVLTVLCRMLFFFDNPTHGHEITECAALSVH